MVTAFDTFRDHLRVAAIAWLVACQGPREMHVRSSSWQPDPNHGELLAAIRRTGCLGACPVYTLTIYRDGDVEVGGKLRGRARTQLDPARLAALEQELAGIPALDDEYPNAGVTDYPTVYLWYRPLGGPTKAIRHDLGDRSAPKQLYAAEHAIDDAVQLR